MSGGLGLQGPGPRLWQSLDKLPCWPQAQAVILAAALALDELHFDASSGPGVVSCQVGMGPGFSRSFSTFMASCRVLLSFRAFLLSLF